MTHRYEREHLQQFFDQDSARTFEDFEFLRCRFENCSLSMTRDVKLRSTFRRIRMVQCEAARCTLESGIVEDVLVDGLRTSGVLHAWGAVFKHVTLRGKIDRIMLSQFVRAVAGATADQAAAFEAANAAYYAGVDWAVDIAEAEFQEAELRGVPGNLVRRDPRTQVLITREKAELGRWKDIDLTDTHWATSLDFFLRDTTLPSIVLVAPKRSRDFARLRDGLERLRAAGVAEPN
jgi:hypothetical protein